MSAATSQDLHALLAECIERMRSEDGTDGSDPMAPFAYDADWEAWALDVDAALAGKQLPRRPRILGALRAWRVGCQFIPGERRMRGTRYDGTRKVPLYISGNWRVVCCDEIPEGQDHLMLPYHVRQNRLAEPTALFITTVRPFKRLSTINPARAVLDYMRRAPKSWRHVRAVYRVAESGNSVEQDGCEISADLQHWHRPPSAGAYHGANSVDVAELLKAVKP